MRLSLVYMTASHLREGGLPEKYGSLVDRVECKVAFLYTVSRLIGIDAIAALLVTDSLVEARRLSVE